VVHPGPQAWHVLESVQLLYQDGRYHLFYNEENVPVTSYLSAPALTGPWNIPAYEYFDPGRAVEIVEAGSVWWVSRHVPITWMGAPFYSVKIDRLQWNGSWRPTVVTDLSIEGWVRLSGTAFTVQPVFWDNTLARGAGPSQFGGNSWIGTYEYFRGPLQSGWPAGTQGDAPVGAIRTAAFTLTGNRIAFRIGGTPDLASCFLGLYTESDSVLRIAATGPANGSEAMQEQVWDVSAWTDSLVYLSIVDQSPSGHINVDEIREFFQPPVTDAAPHLLQARLHANAPNPFNPRTTIAFDMPRAGRVRLDIFDVRGRWLRGLVDATLPAGAHRAIWDGRLENGSEAASGTYVYRLRLDGVPAGVRTATLVK
jgi:hypothetical protein